MSNILVCFPDNGTCSKLITILVQLKRRYSPHVRLRPLEIVSPAILYVEIKPTAMAQLYIGEVYLEVLVPNPMQVDALMHQYNTPSYPLGRGTRVPHLY